MENVNTYCELAEYEEEGGGGGEKFEEKRQDTNTSICDLTMPIVVSKMFMNNSCERKYSCEREK